MQFTPTTPRSELGDDEVDLREFILAVQRHWRRIGVIAAGILLVAAAVVLFSRPQFSVVGSLFLGQAQTGAPPQVPSNLGFLANFQSVSDVDTQVELLSSQALVEQAILESGINSPVSPTGAHAPRYWRWRLLQGGQITAFGPQRRQVSANFASFTGTVTNTVTLDIVIGADNKYRILDPGDWFKRSHLVLRGTLGRPAAGGGLRLLLKAAISTSPPRPGQRFVLKVTPPQLLADKMTANLLTVTAGGTVTQPSQVATVVLKWSNPYGGKTFVEHLMQDFIASQLLWSTDSASSTADFVAQQLGKVRAALKTADQNLASYQSHTGLLNVDANAKAVISQLSSYEVQRTTIRLQQKALQQLANEMASPRPPLNPYLVSQSNDPALGQLADQLATDQATLMSLRIQFSPQAPQVQAERATISKLEDAIKSMVDNDVSAASTSLASIDRSIELFKADIGKMPSASLNVTSLERSSNVYGQLYVLLMQDEEDAEVSKAASVSNTRVVSPAELPTAPSWPKATLTLAIALMLGPFFGIIVILMQRALSGRFQSEIDIRRSVSPSIFGLIPRRSRHDALSDVFPADASDPLAEAFRIVRGKIYLATPEPRPHVLAIIATTRDDDVAMVSVNVAKALADDRKSVILVDADFRGGTLYELLEQPQAPGLAEWLVDRTTPLIKPLSGQSFAFLPAGNCPADPSTALNEQDLARVLATLQARFDFVIFCCPPMPSFSDGMVIGRRADLVLSVVCVEQTSRARFAALCESIGTVALALGIVITRTDPPSRQNFLGGRHKLGMPRGRRSTKGLATTEPALLSPGRQSTRHEQS